MPQKQPQKLNAHFLTKLQQVSRGIKLTDLPLIKYDGGVY